MKFKRLVRKGLRITKEVAIYFVAIALFITGYIFSDTYITKEITDEQYEICRETMHNLYIKDETNLLDIPDDMYFDNEQRIIGFHGHFGHAKSIIENGKILVIREREISFRTFINICIGIAGIFVVIIINEIAKYIYEKVKNME